VGSQFQIQSDHKPLVSVLGSRELLELPPRTQPYRLRLIRFCFKIVHVPDKALVIADALSRAEEEKAELADHFLCMELNALPATQKRFAEIKAMLAEYPVSVTIANYVTRGWPQKSKLSPPTKPFFPFREELSVHDGLLLLGSKPVLPPFGKGLYKIL